MIWIIWKLNFLVSEAKKRGKDFKAVGNREFIMLEENSLRHLKAEIRIKFKFTGPMTVKKTLKGPNVTEATVDKDIVLEQLQQS